MCLLQRQTDSLKRLKNVSSFVEKSHKLCLSSRFLSFESRIRSECDRFLFIILSRVSEQDNRQIDARTYCEKPLVFDQYKVNALFCCGGQGNTNQIDKYVLFQRTSI